MTLGWRDSLIYQSVSVYLIVMVVLYPNDELRESSVRVHSFQAFTQPSYSSSLVTGIESERRRIYSIYRTQYDSILLSLPLYSYDLRDSKPSQFQTLVRNSLKPFNRILILSNVMVKNNTKETIQCFSISIPGIYFRLLK